MSQVAVDANGKKIRWDESKKEWVPVETAVNDKGVNIEFDGNKWNPIYKTEPKKQPVVSKITTAPPKSLKEQLKDIMWSRGGMVPGPRNESLEMKSFKDVGQAFGAAATGLAAFPVSTAVSAGAMSPNFGVPPLPPELAEMVGQRAGEAITIRPTTTGAQAGMKALTTPFAPFGAAIEAMPTPETRIALSVAMLLYPYAKGITKGLLGQRIKSGRGVAPAEVEAVAKNIKDLPPEVAAKAKASTRLQEPPTPTGKPLEDAAALEKFNVEQRAREASTPGDVGAFPKADIPPVKPGEIPPVKVGKIPGINANPARVLADALKQAPRLLPRQKAMYRKEVGEKFKKAEEAGGSVGGERGVQAALSQMTGKLRKVDFDMPVIDPASRDALFQMVWDDPYLTMGERLAIFGGKETQHSSASGLIGMLDYGKFPAKHEVELMTRVFGQEVGDALIGKLSTKEQLSFWATNIANVPRTLMASFDLSAPLRQGIWFIGRPRQFGSALKAMFESLKSEKGYNATVQRMAQKPTFSLARESGLALTEIGSALSKTEETFIGSGIIERLGTSALKKWPDVRGKAINLIPEGVKASQRAYTGFLNKLRADVFDRMVNDAKDMGLYTDTKTGAVDIFGNEALSKQIARYVNIGSGRGNLSKLASEHSSLINAAFFSPRLMSARFALFDPRTYTDVAYIPRKVLGGKKYPFTKLEIIGKESQPKVNVFVRQQAMRDSASFMAFYTLSAAVAKLVLGQDLGADSRSSDFTKIISGNTSIDLAGGIGQYARLGITVAQPLLKQLGVIDEAFVVSSSSGKKTEMGGGFNQISVGDAIVKFFAQKENPVFSGLMSVAFQQDPMGRPLDLEREVTTRLIPIMVQDMVELYKDDPDGLKLAIMGTLAMFGAGVQTYPPKDEKSLVDRTKKTRQEKLVGKPTGDIVVDELKKNNVKAVLGAKKIGGQTITEESIDKVLKDAGPEIRARVMMYINNPAYAKATPEQRGKWLQKAVNAGWAAYKNKLKMGVK